MVRSWDADFSCILVRLDFANTLFMMANTIAVCVIDESELFGPIVESRLSDVIRDFVIVKSSKDSVDEDSVTP